MTPLHRLSRRLLSLRTLHRQSLITLGAVLITTLLGYVATMYFARTLGQGILGAYFLFLSYLGIAGLVTDGGFKSAAIKRISEGRDQGAYFGAFIVLRLILFAGMAAVLLAAQPLFVDMNASGVFLWLIVSLGVEAVVSITGIGVYGTGKTGAHQVGRIASALVRIAVQITAVAAGLGLAGLAGGFVAGIIAGGAVNLLFLPIAPARFTTRHLRSLFSFSLWALLSGSSMVIIGNADSILIGYFLENADVGLYRVAFQFAGMASLAAGVLSTVLFPAISSLHARREMEGVQRILGRGISWSLALAVPVCVGGLFLGKRLLYFLYGASFTPAAGAFFVLLLAQGVSAMLLLETTAITAMDRPKAVFLLTGSAAVVNVLLTVTLIPVLGITGAAAATSASTLLQAVGAHRIIRGDLGSVIEWRSIRSIAVSAGGLALFLGVYLAAVSPTWFPAVLVAVVGGGAVYFSILLVIDDGLRREVAGILRATE
ncbi:MAG: oligosaccharide flippase family protein [Methanomicrobiales archaeon]